MQRVAFYNAALANVDQFYKNCLKQQELRSFKIAFRKKNKYIFKINQKVPFSVNEVKLHRSISYYAPYSAFVDVLKDQNKSRST